MGEFVGNTASCSVVGDFVGLRVGAVDGAEEKHGPVLHWREPESVGHVTPPKLAGVTTDLLRVWIPPSHDLEHVLHADHPETLQSMGQEKVLHTRCSELGHSSPPSLAATSIS